MKGGGSFKVILDTQQIWVSLNWTISSLFKKGGGWECSLHSIHDALYPISNITQNRAWFIFM